MSAEQDSSCWRNSHLFSAVNESLLLRGDPFLLFHPFFNSLNLHLHTKKPTHLELTPWINTTSQCEVVFFIFQEQLYFTLSVGSMSISISFPVRVWNITLTWSHQHKLWFLKKAHAVWYRPFLWTQGRIHSKKWPLPSPRMMWPIRFCDLIRNFSYKNYCKCFNIVFCRDFHLIKSILISESKWSI